MPSIKRPRAKNMNNVDVSRIIQINKPDVKFKDIVGCESAKLFLKDWCFAIKESDDYYKNFGCEVPKSCLIYGDRGNGKMSLARALCYNTNALFYNIKITDIINKWFSESEKNLESIFYDAFRRSEEEKCPAILFFGDLDAIFCPPDHFSRESLSLRLSQVLCNLMRGFHNSKDIYILGRTCHIEKVHPDVKQMFDYQFEVQIPNSKERIKFLEIEREKAYGKCNRKIQVNSDWINADFELVSKNLEGFSYIHIQRMFTETLRQKAIAWKNSNSREFYREKSLETISSEDFIKIILENTYIS